MSYQRYTDEEVVVDCARIGCSYAQSKSKSKNKEQWETRTIRIDHDHGEKQNGAEVAHNHDCIPITNIPAFSACHSPYYLESLKLYMEKHPDEAEQYRPAYNTAYLTQGSSNKPPCILLLLDTWFEYSDIQISKDYYQLQTAMDTIMYDINSRLKNLYDWAIAQIRKEKERIKPYIVSNPSYAAPKEEVPKGRQYYLDKDTALSEAKDEIVSHYGKRVDLINMLKEHWYEIRIFESDYQKELKSFGTEVKNYKKLWRNSIDKAELDKANENYKSFDTYFSNLAKAEFVSQRMLNWENQAEYALLTSSFLICRCGGKIEFLTSGAEHSLYCQKLFLKIRGLLYNTSLYFQELLDENRFYMGLDDEENRASIGSACDTLKNIYSAFLYNGDFELDEGTKSVQFRLITRGYNKEKKTKINAMIGLVLLTKLAWSGGVAVSAGLLAYDLYGVATQKEDEKNENGVGNATMVLNDIASVVAGGISKVGEKVGIESGLAAMDTMGKGTVVISFLSNLSALFYTSEDDWIEDVEITVFTPYMAHIIKQRFDKNVEEKDPFNGIKMVRAKTKVDYAADSLKCINWDELEGSILEIEKNYGTSDGDVRKVVGNTDEFKDELGNGTNGVIE